MIRINLAPPRPRGNGLFHSDLEHGHRLRRGRPAARGSAGWLGGASAEIHRLNTDIAENKEAGGEAQAVIAEGQRFRQDKELLERRVNAIELAARQTRGLPADAVLDTLPKDLWLTRMEEKGTQLRFAGTTFSATALSDFMASLKATGKFKDVDIVDAKQDLAKSPRLITFEVVTRFEP
jgi:Tfp pilus assembly protein PilN